MKAYIMDVNRNLVIADMPEPDRTSDNIVMRIQSASICGTDIRAFTKGNPKIEPPRIMGHECAGEIVHCGETLSEYGFSVGDAVTIAPAIGCGKCWPCSTGHTNMCDNLKTIGFQFEGAFTQLIAIPKQAVVMGNVIKLPESVDYDTATLLEPAACALSAQKYLNISEGDYVLVYGAGFIGCLHAEMAFLSGAAKVMIVEPSEKRGSQITEKIPGAIWINPVTQNTGDEVLKITEGRGANVVITATSVSSVHEEAQIVASKMGRISLFGGLAGESKGFLDSNLIHYKELQVFGAHATSPSVMREVLVLVQNGSLNLKKYIEKTVTLEKIEDAFIALRDEHIMKVVVHPNN